MIKQNRREYFKVHGQIRRAKAKLQRIRVAYRVRRLRATLQAIDEAILKNPQRAGRFESLLKHLLAELQQ